MSDEHKLFEYQDFAVPVKEWVGLTDEERRLCCYKKDTWRECVDAIEAALKEKNA